MSYAPYPADAPDIPAVKPYRVTAYRSFGILVTRCFVVGDYRHYWQANIVSFVWHHFFGYGCNTWKHNALSKATGEQQ